MFANLDISALFTQVHKKQHLYLTHIHVYIETLWQVVEAGMRDDTFDFMRSRFGTTWDGVVCVFVTSRRAVSKDVLFTHPFSDITSHSICQFLHRLYSDPRANTGVWREIFFAFRNRMRTATRNCLWWLRATVGKYVHCDLTGLAYSKSAM